MKIHVLSDLHVEFGEFVIPKVDAEVLVLAGDVLPGLAGLKYAMAQASDRPIIYVAGNHEYYGHALPRLTDKLRDMAARSHIRFLEEEEFVCNGVRFLGCTLWTDFLLYGADQWLAAKMEAQETMTDYRRIRKSPEFRKLRPADTIGVHARSKAWLRQRLSEPFGGPTVVVTHHAPTPRALKHDDASRLLSCAYASDMEELIRACGPAVWIHGHTHVSLDLPIHNTRVLSNPRGYVGEIVPGFDPRLVIEL